MRQHAEWHNQLIDYYISWRQLHVSRLIVNLQTSTITNLDTSILTCQVVDILT